MKSSQVVFNNNTPVNFNTDINSLNNVDCQQIQINSVPEYSDIKLTETRGVSKSTKVKKGRLTKNVKKCVNKEEFKEKEGKVTQKTILKLRNELNYIQSSILNLENTYKNSIKSSKYMGSLFGSFEPFITGINKFSQESLVDQNIYSEISYGGRSIGRFLKNSYYWFLIQKKINAENQSIEDSKLQVLNVDPLNEESKQECNIGFHLALETNNQLFPFSEINSKYLENLENTTI
ncbi:uncharacterized protein CMU_005940 [Cryptosporidium muris RN66]|uniref:Uncharacterized protein n=1 Tax=Cryptosporidium muris (strain RN66) TaxID=441375 RepID=B6AHH6_CRYMR|nr:uncharacterized protein CMU_005940 [Cryptosporidium muris RN66]EEA07671.1 hypothetical protein, conserved [Cryptosporidium muris RN66]|eukprot:XP_002142020.1 hypothetical protein [Cryptosporidium muris RN66]